MRTGRSCVGLTAHVRTRAKRALVRSARHAVGGTLYSRAQRIGVNAASCLLCGLSKNLSFELIVIVVICMLVCPLFEVSVLPE